MTNDGLRKAFMRAVVKIALAVIVTFPMLLAVERIRGHLGEGFALLALVAGLLLALIVVENMAAIIIAHLK